MTPEQRRAYTVEVRIDSRKHEWVEWSQHVDHRAATRAKDKAARLARVIEARVVRSEDR